MPYTNDDIDDENKVEDKDLSLDELAEQELDEDSTEEEEDSF
jgi:hypothetical protein